MGREIFYDIKQLLCFENFNFKKYLLGHSLAELVCNFVPDILMAMPGALIYEINEIGMNATPLEQVEHYIVTKTFLNNPAAYFREEE